MHSGPQSHHLREDVCFDSTHFFSLPISPLAAFDCKSSGVMETLTHTITSLCDLCCLVRRGISHKQKKNKNITASKLCRIKRKTVKKEDGKQRGGGGG